MRERGVNRVIVPQSVTDGAGVHLRRSIATAELDHLDPFFLFDHFGSENPEDYIAGFPMHPHRGIETVTYMLDGSVAHRDSLGNSGVIGAGDVQWMTAGSGIMHEEMPKVGPHRLDGFQLWVNLPARLKMTTPRYQGLLARSIPEITRADGVRVRVIAGEVDGTPGAVREIFAAPSYLDVALPARAHFVQPVPRGHTALVYVFAGAVSIGGEGDTGGAGGKPVLIAATRLAVLGDGEVVVMRGGGIPSRLLLISAQPLGEPYVRYGPFVMNTRDEITQAILELRLGTFVRH